MHWKSEIELALGYFDVALSFSEDSHALALQVAAVGKFHKKRCYLYSDHVVAQCGFDIYEVMKFVYSRTPRVIVLNTPLYGATKATKFEFDQIKSNSSLLGLYEIQRGGEPLHHPSLSICKLDCKRPSELIEVFQF